MAAALPNKPQGLLPSNTKKNPRKQANAITLRSDRQLGQHSYRTLMQKAQTRLQMKTKKNPKSEENSIQKTVDPQSVQLSRRPEDEVAPEPEPVKKSPVRPYVPPVPFP